MLESLQFDKYQHEKVFSDQYPIHDSEALPEVADDRPHHQRIRQNLHKHWAKLRNFFIMQPFDTIQVIQSYLSSEISDNLETFMLF